MDKHTPGPWTWRDVSGAGLQISATLPEGFKFDGTAYGADGKTSFMVWTVRERYTVQIADERWVQFSTGSWSEMQKANACLIAAAPELFDALRAMVDRWEPDTEGQDRIMWETAREALAKARPADTEAAGQ